MDGMSPCVNVSLLLIRIIKRIYDFQIYLYSDFQLSARCPDQTLLHRYALKRPLSVTTR